MSYATGQRQQVNHFKVKSGKILMKINPANISVGIVTYNSSEDIEKCLNSLKKSIAGSQLNIEVIVFDNKSPDAKTTENIINNKFADVKLITSGKNLGFGYGHNEIIKNIKSDYHLILNPDIEFTENTLLKLAEYMESNSDIELITPEIHNTDGTIQHLPKVFPRLRYVMSSTIPFLKKYRTDYTMSDEIIKKPTDIEICTGCFMFARTKTLKKIHGFDDNFFLYFEDFDLSMRIGKLGRIVYYPLTSVTHVWHRDTKKSLRPFVLQINSMFKFYKKWSFKK